MTHSISQTATLACPQCGHAFPAEIWLIVDGDERPDLLARAASGDLHRLPCPQCGNAGTVDTPLLILRPGAPAPLLFSPAEHTTREQDQEHLQGLLGALQGLLGADWQDAWLETLQIVPRPILPVALSSASPEDLRQRLLEALPPSLREAIALLEESGEEIRSEEDLRRLLERRPDLRQRLESALNTPQPEDAPAEPTSGDAPPAQEPPPEEGTEESKEINPAIQRLFEEAGDLGQTLLACLQVRSPEEHRQLLEAHPELLEDAGLHLLEELLAQESRPQAQQRLRFFLSVHHRAREVGTEKAFAEMQTEEEDSLRSTILKMITAETWSETEEFIHAHPELLSDEVEQILEQLVQTAQERNDENARNIFEEHLQILHRAREVGTEKAFAEMQTEEEDSLRSTILKMITAETWTKTEEFINAHPELLSDEAEQILEQLVQSAQERNDENARNIFEEHLQILHRAREVGTEKAFAEMQTEEEDSLHSTIMKMITAETWSKTEEFINAHPELLSDKAEQILEQLVQTAQEKNDEKARNIFEEHLQILRRAREVGTEKAFAEMREEDELNQRFQSLLTLKEKAQNQPALWGEALSGWQNLIVEAERKGNHRLAALARVNLANTCSMLYEVTGNTLWAEQAQKTFTEVSLIFNREQYPQEWAMTQHSLGNLFLRRYERSGEDAHAQTAQAHYQNALQIRTRDDAPSHWAMTQHSLGNLFLDRYERSGQDAHAQTAQAHY
ncbi:CpXC domain-containing protein, partial [uncultured Anaerolinea sp.]|uniref:CpXC domain-containing protein n=1 Tax=uncultured Anaerolinea sp. TaxID=430695 RepID=UPI002639B03D